MKKVLLGFAMILSFALAIISTYYLHVGHQIIIDIATYLDNYGDGYALFVLIAPAILVAVSSYFNTMFWQEIKGVGDNPPPFFVINKTPLSLQID